MHFHAYSWIGACGPKSDFYKEIGRRPPPRSVEPGDPQVSADFIKTHMLDWKASDLPPVEIAHWLLRSPKHIKGTFKEPAAALPWLSEWLDRMPYASARDKDDWVRYRRVLSAGEELSRGQSLSLGWYLTEQRFGSVAVVSCAPNNYYPGIACPETW